MAVIAMHFLVSSTNKLEHGQLNSTKQIAWIFSCLTALMCFFFLILCYSLKNVTPHCMWLAKHSYCFMKKKQKKNPVRTQINCWNKQCSCAHALCLQYSMHSAVTCFCQAASASNCCQRRPELSGDFKQLILQCITCEETELIFSARS